MSSQTTQQVALVVGASRGIGRQVAVDLARNGYAVAVSAKSTSDASAVHPFPPDPNSPQSTISTVAREIREAGGTAHAVAADVRDPASIQHMVAETVRVLGRLDVLVYNAGAIFWNTVEATSVKRFQLMQRVNPEGLYAAVQAALPHFAKQGWQGRIIVVSPPIYSRFFRGKTAYAMGKVAMSVLTKGLAVDFERQGRSGMAITSIWPAVTIQSAATGDADPASMRSAAIYSDAILAMLRAPTAVVNGLLALDEDFLREHAGYTDADIEKYTLVKGSKPRRIMPAVLPDLTVAEQDDEGDRKVSTKL
ncbi:NAD(P)-binding protein [Athelia psychrophila]|uniref:NAD(P)-binding protein n=1 Tax=Athelia psychrophila TaxID=1759441 RepID=A0A167U702_9AGAM|nr:NAD(P)-binding protein [Fibularhizoctonia sp. CBS 109695]